MVAIDLLIGISFIYWGISLIFWAFDLRPTGNEALLYPEEEV